MIAAFFPLMEHTDLEFLIHINANHRITSFGGVTAAAAERHHIAGRMNRQNTIIFCHLRWQGPKSQRPLSISAPDAVGDRLPRDTFSWYSHTLITASGEPDPESRKHQPCRQIQVALGADRVHAYTNSSERHDSAEVLMLPALRFR